MRALWAKWNRALLLLAAVLFIGWVYAMFAESCDARHGTLIYGPNILACVGGQP